MRLHDGNVPKKAATKGSPLLQQSTLDLTMIIYRPQSTPKRLYSVILPCGVHYKRTKDKYRALLDNLRCICKVMLSLIIESYSVLPHHSYVESRSLTKVTSNGSVPASTMQEADVRSKRFCRTLQSLNRLARRFLKMCHDRLEVTLRR